MRFVTKTSFIAKIINHSKLFRISLQVTTLLLIISGVCDSRGRLKFRLLAMLCCAWVA